MDSVYSILGRWGTEWDGQSIVYTKSKALFEQLQKDYYKNVYFDDFSDELKSDIREAYDKLDLDYDLDPIEDIDLTNAIEFLEVSHNYPMVVLDHTEFTPSWNW